MSSFRHDGSRDGIISSDTNAEHESPAENPGHLEVWCRNAVWQTDAEYDSNDSDNKFVPVDESAAEYIAKVSEGKLSDNVANIGSRIHKTAKQRRIVRRFVVQPSPVSVMMPSCSAKNRRVSMRKVPPESTYSYVQIGVARLTMNRSYESRKKPTLVVDR